MVWVLRNRFMRVWLKYFWKAARGVRAAASRSQPHQRGTRPPRNWAGWGPGEAACTGRRTLAACCSTPRPEPRHSRKLSAQVRPLCTVFTGTPNGDASFVSRPRECRNGGRRRLSTEDRPPCQPGLRDCQNSPIRVTKARLGCAGEVPQVHPIGRSENSFCGEGQRSLHQPPVAHRHLAADNRTPARTRRSSVNR